MWIKRLDLRRRRIGRLRGADIAKPLLDAADPIQAVGIARIERNRLAKMRERSFDLVQLETDLAKLMVERGVVRPLLDQLREQRLGDHHLAGRHQRLHQVGARRPMRRIGLQRLEIQGDRALGIAALLLHIAEIAPAGRQMRRNPQRRGVIHAGKRKLAADHVDITQLGMQLGLGRHRQIVGRITAGRLQPALVGRYRLLNPPAGLVLVPLHEVLHHGEMNDFIDGGGGGLGAGHHGFTHRKDRLTMTVTGKQNPSDRPTARLGVA